MGNFRNELSEIITVALMFLAFATMLLVADCCRRNKDMYKIEFELANGEKALIWTDADGIVKDAVDIEVWIDHVVIGVASLKDGDVMEMYNLYSDIMMPGQYKVIKIEGAQ